MKNRYPKYLFLTFLIALFLAQFFFISPKGEFALNDDWVHTDTIKHWVETGEFRLMPFAGPTFYVPILYGAALTKIFGFSFTLLRISTLFIAILSLIAYFLLLNRITSRPTLAFIGTLILWSNPVFYNLSFTFMTDIPALLFLIISIYFYYLGFEKQKNKYLFCGTIFGLLSAFSRQTGILIIIAAFIYGVKNFKTLKLYNFITSFGIPLAVAGAIYTYLNIYQLLPQNTGSHVIEGAWRLLGHIKWWLFYIPMYLGLFTLPLTLPWFIKHKSAWRSKKFWILFFSIAGLTIAIRQIWHLQFPYIGNIISYYGLGPMKNALSGQLTPAIPSWAWGIITMFCAFGLSLIAYLLLFHKRNNSEPTGFIYLFGLLYLIPLLIFESFDRYLLPLLIVLIIALMQNIKHVKFSYSFSLILILFFALFSLTQTKFYLAWNQTRWNLANQNMMRSNDATKIDAGYEWDGWHNYWPTLSNEKLAFTDAEIQTRPWWQRRFFPDNNAEYIVSFSPLEGYDIVEKKEVSGLNPNNKLYLLKNNKLADTAIF